MGFEDKFTPTPKPEWIPHQYQEKGIALGLDYGALALFLDPGLGKTSIALEIFRLLKEAGMIDRLVVMAPLRVAAVSWPDEIEKWSNFADMSYTLVHGPKKKELMQQDSDVYLLNFDILNTKIVEELPEWLEGLGRTLLIIDESTGFKNHRAKRTKKMKLLAPLFTRRIIMTGTPNPNGLEGLFSQFFMLDLGRSLGRYITHFRNEFMNPDPYNQYQWNPRPGAYEEIIGRVSPFTLRLKASDYLKLPKLIFDKRYVTLPKKARKIYDALKKEFLAILDGEELLAPNAAACLTKLRQISNGAVYTDDKGGFSPLHSEKISAVEGIINELDGKPALLLYQFKHDLVRLREALGDFPTLSGTPPTEARQLVKDFNAGKIPILAGHPASMGHGLNLQEGNCHHMIWLGLTYDLELWLQTIKRIERQGNEADTIFVHCVMAFNSVDDIIFKVLQDKDGDQESFLKQLKQDL